MDCDTCSKTLAQVLREERPKKLLQAIHHGLSVRRGETSSTKTSPSTATATATTEAIAAVQEPHPLAKLECRICPETGPASGARAFLEAPPPSIVLCANRLATRREVEEAMVHELVHAFDYLVSGRNLLDCQALAYSEVRAAHAAECSELSRSFTCSFFEKGCVRSMATRSTENLFPGRGAGCVNAVFDSAYNDRAPYDQAAGAESEVMLPPRDPQASHASAGDSSTGGGNDRG